MTEHQKFLSKAFVSMPCVEYLFIETSEPDDSFQSVNYAEDPEMNFIVGFDELRSNQKKYLKIINGADVVIHGSAPDSLIIERIRSNRLTFRYCERLYKDGFPSIKYIRNMLAAWLHHGRFKQNNLYMLCTSAFSYADCLKFGNYKDRCYKWGYFPNTEVFDIKECVDTKRPGSIVWASRFIDWKHPEIPVIIAERLKNEGYDFSLTLYGKGEMFDEISSLIKEKGLDDKVTLDDSKNSEELRKIMKASSIFLHTADRKEGWGVVINEAMNSGCAVVASHIVGSVPYLIENNRNGMIYEDGNIDDLYGKIKQLLDDPEKVKDMGIKAYNTIVDIWNGRITAERFVDLSNAILNGNKHPDLYEDGPCSRAEIINDDWFVENRKV